MFFFCLQGARREFVLWLVMGRLALEIVRLLCNPGVYARPIVYIWLLLATTPAGRDRGIVKAQLRRIWQGLRIHSPWGRRRTSIK